MSYDKPKVTIDLAEYNELLAKATRLEQADSGEDQVALKMAICALYNNRGRSDNAYDELRREGIFCEALNPHNSFKARLSVTDISIFVKK